tara:strand:+ start:762 stop:1031 length:270 start_codon:yes stop_codon:yes gene_type:complete
MAISPSQVFLNNSRYLAGITILPFVSKVRVLEPYIPKLINILLYNVTLSCTFTHFYTLLSKLPDKNATKIHPKISGCGTALKKWFEVKK